MPVRSHHRRRRQRGSSAIEFAVVAPVTALMIFGIIETSIYFFKKHFVRYVTFELARDIQTGEIQRSDDPEAAFRASVCLHAPDFMDCEDLRFDVRSFDSVADISFTPPVFDEDGIPTNFVFEPGEQEDITTMIGATRHNFTTPLLKRFFQQDGSPVIVTGYSITKNEPFGCLTEC